MKCFTRCGKILTIKASVYAICVSCLLCCVFYCLTVAFNEKMPFLKYVLDRPEVACVSVSRSVESTKRQVVRTMCHAEMCQTWFLISF